MRREWIEIAPPKIGSNIAMSPSMRREWIEIRLEIDIAGVPHTSPSMRREWIEILTDCELIRTTASPSMRREWIEISRKR